MNEIKFEVGDRVWSFEHQEWGKVVETATNGEAKVYLPSSLRWIRNRLLFFEEVIIPERARTRPKPKFDLKHDLKIDDRVLVRDMGERWWPRHFAGWSDDGHLETFNDGCTSWGSDGGTKVWEEWKLPDQTPKHEFKPGDVVLLMDENTELRIFVRLHETNSDLAVLKFIGNSVNGESSFFEHFALLYKVQPYKRTLLGFDAVEEIPY